jgi:hypothetical protein
MFSSEPSEREEERELRRRVRRRESEGEVATQRELRPREGVASESAMEREGGRRSYAKQRELRPSE